MVDSACRATSDQTISRYSRSATRQPRRAEQRHFRPAPRAFALDGARPQICDGEAAVVVVGVERAEFLLRLGLHPRAPLAELVGELRAVARDELQLHLVEQHGDGVEVARDRLGPDAHRLQRDRPASGEGVEDNGRAARVAAKGLVGGLHQRAGGGEVHAVGAVVPVGEVADELQQRVPQVLGVVPVPALAAHRVTKRLEFALRRVAKRGRAQRVGGVGPERGEDDRATRGQRPTRPPQVQRGDVPVAEGLLPAGVVGDDADREVDLDEALAGGCHGSLGMRSGEIW